MIYEAYSMKDTKAGSFGIPFFKLNQNLAQRDFVTLIKQADGIMKQFPADFELWKVGSWDDQTGIMNGGIPVYIMNGVEAVNMT